MGVGKDNSMKTRKQKEIKYYDKRAKEWLRNKFKKEKNSGSKEFSPFVLNSYEFLKSFLKNKCSGKRILDYGCGDGINSTWLAEYGGEIIGIDLSKESLQIAKRRAEKEKMEERVKFLPMDCENLELPDNYFDIVFNGGTFSSLDIDKALPEVSRVLKPKGFLIGIETLGHNPFTNFKRKINEITGKRTKWAVNHIFKIDDLKKTERYFDKTETYFFHLISWLAFPFLNFPGGKVLLKILEKLDKCLLYIFPFFKKYSFKIIFIFSLPHRENLNSDSN